MGTNFYWIAEAFWQSGPLVGEPVDVDRNDPTIHIGKRSAASLYCWDCDVTLCVGGNDSIHKGNGEWLAACPRCGQGPRVKPSLSEGAAAIELGFAAPRGQRPTGVQSCSSFTWAQDPATVRGRCQEETDDPLVCDEYGRKFTGAEFLRMLEANCPIEFTDSIGRWFC